MDDLLDLYQQLVVEHGRRPRNVGSLPVPPARRVDGDNPLCGDRISVFVQVADDRVEDVKFEAEGCAISTAAASLMSEAVVGKTVEEAHALVAVYRHMLTEDGGPNGETRAAMPSDLGKLEALRGVRAYPSRVKCATLAWHALEAALNLPDTPAPPEEAQVTTE